MSQEMQLVRYEQVAGIKFGLHRLVGTRFEQAALESAERQHVISESIPWYWSSDCAVEWNKLAYKCSGKIAVGGSLRGVAGLCRVGAGGMATRPRCKGHSVVCDECGIMSVELDVQRTPQDSLHLGDAGGFCAVV